VFLLNKETIHFRIDAQNEIQKFAMRNLFEHTHESNFQQWVFQALAIKKGNCNDHKMFALLLQRFQRAPMSESLV
jgi:hypothetical protein